jgi:hypothetical protein
LTWEFAGFTQKGGGGLSTSYTFTTTGIYKVTLKRPVWSKTTLYTLFVTFPEERPKSGISKLYVIEFPVVTNAFILMDVLSTTILVPILILLLLSLM